MMVKIYNVSNFGYSILRTNARFRSIIIIKETNRFSPKNARETCPISVHLPLKFSPHNVRYKSNVKTFTNKC